MTAGAARTAAAAPGVRPPRWAPFPARVRTLLAAALLLAPLAPPDRADAQDLPRGLAVSFPGGEGTTFPVVGHRGYAAVPASALAPLGWRSREAGGRPILEHRTGLRLAFAHGSPYLLWDGSPVHMADAAYLLNEELHVPLQLLVDLLPGFLPQAYRFDEAEGVLRVAEAARGPLPAPPPRAGPADSGHAGAPAADAGGADGETRAPAEASPEPRAERVQPSSRAPRVVVIDPGHGGDDPGAVGRGGAREKDVALAVGLALAAELAGDPEIEVRLTRDRDVAVPLWRRGEMATEWKGDRPGVFVSLHANSLGNRPAVRGFETYFLSEARTEHERRVAAAENAPMLREREDGNGPPLDDPLLASILRDLRTFDHQHWSALLADQVQREMGRFHPGPDRGVKQGPFAVITNAMMPSVLVELGFLSHRDEERLLQDSRFHREAARAIAAAVREFFERYPPGGSGS